MPVEPRDLWSALCADLRNAILAELAAALQEVSDDLGRDPPPKQWTPRISS